MPIYPWGREIGAMDVFRTALLKGFRRWHNAARRSRLFDVMRLSVFALMCLQA
jgi:hypothetical protein